MSGLSDNKIRVSKNTMERCCCRSSTPLQFIVNNILSVNNEYSYGSYCPYTKELGIVQFSQWALGILEIKETQIPEVHRALSIPIAEALALKQYLDAHKDLIIALSYASAENTHIRMLEMTRILEGIVKAFREIKRSEAPDAHEIASRDYDMVWESLHTALVQSLWCPCRLAFGPNAEKSETNWWFLTNVSRVRDVSSIVSDQVHELLSPHIASSRE